jgi:hypothetical protein
MWTACLVSALCPLAGPCEHINKPPAAKKGEEM